MGLKTFEKVETNRVKLEVEVDAQTFDNAINKAYRKEVKKMNIPGFRRGKATRAMVEKLYGEQIFYDDAMQSVYPEALDAAIKEANLDVVRDRIDLDVVSVGKEGFTFTAVVTVMPEVTIEGYKGIEVTPKSTEVTDELIDEEINRVRERNGRLITVEDRAAQNGDIAVIDFEGFVDGVAFDGGKAENYDLSLGSNSFIPGFEEQIVGHTTGEEFSIFVKFPDDYQAEELKGKDAEFKINLHEIKVRELPELDDEFVKDVSEKDTVEEYKAEISEKLAEKLKNESETDVEDQIVNKLVELLQGEIPEAMYTNKAEEMVEELDARLRQQGLDIKTYSQYMGTDINGLRDMYRPQAEIRVKLRLALEKIAVLEGFEITDDDVEAEYNKLAEAYKMSADRIKNIIPVEEIKKDIGAERAMNLVKDNAVKS
ncbi:MAG: trigger factor [Acutalibacteraceae bacterium]